MNILLTIYYFCINLILYVVSLDKLPTTARNDYEIITAAIIIDANNIKYVPPFLIDEELAKIVISSLPYLIHYIPMELRTQAVILPVLHKYPCYLMYFSKLWDCKKAALIVTKYASATLKDVSERLRDDMDVVMAAVENNGNVLHYASSRLQCNSTVIYTAVRNDVTVLNLIPNETLHQFNVLRKLCVLDGIPIWLVRTKSILKFPVCWGILRDIIDILHD